MDMIHLPRPFSSLVKPIITSIRTNVQNNRLRNAFLSFQEYPRHRTLMSASIQFDAMENQQSSPSMPISSPTEESKRLGKRKVAMHIGYEGTLYRGLQAQRSLDLTDTIEDALESALFATGGILENNRGSLDKIAWSRSSRTDKKVHSISTVVTLKLECSPESFDEDPNGITLAQQINAHLPPTIRVFSIQRVTKGFNARPECIRRTYDYFLPVSVLGKDIDSAEFKERFELLKKAWAQFEGYRAFHNYTKRKLYRSKGGGGGNKAVTSSRDDDMDDDDEDDENNSNGSSDEDVVINNTTTEQQQQATITNTTTTNTDVNTINTTTNDDDDDDITTTRIHKINLVWKSVREDNDPVTRRHYRFIESCTITDQSIMTISPNGEPCIRMTIKGASFMLHQIRHMVGCAVAVSLGLIPFELIEASLSAPLRMSLPLAPPSTLLLTDSEFSAFRVSWNGKKADVCKWTGDKLTLREPGQNLQREFAAEQLFPALNELLRGEEWTGWVDILNRLRYDQSEVDEVMRLYGEWRSEREAIKEAREKELLAKKSSGGSDGGSENEVS